MIFLKKRLRQNPSTIHFARKEDKPKRVRVPKEQKPPRIPHEKNIYICLNQDQSIIIGNKQPILK